MSDDLRAKLASMDEEQKSEALKNMLKSLKDQEDLEWNLIDACFLFWEARKQLYTHGNSGISVAKLKMYQAMADLWGPLENDPWSLEEELKINEER